MKIRRFAQAILLGCTLGSIGTYGSQATAAPSNTGTTTKTVEPSMYVRPTTRQRDTVASTVKERDKPPPVSFGFLGGVGFPRPLMAEVLLKVADTVSIGGEYSAMPSTTVGAIAVGYRAYAVDLRIFPLQSSFFIGARVLRQHLDASATINAETYGNYSGSLAMDTWYVNPRMGFLWTFGSGLTVGMDAGVQIPTSHTSTLSLPTSLPPGVTVPSSITTVTDTLGAKIIPTVTLLQLGMVF